MRSDPGLRTSGVAAGRVRAGAALAAAGEAIAFATLFFATPGAFVSFMLGGGALIALGVAVSLWGLLAREPASDL